MTTKKKTDDIHITKALKELADIAEWFESTGEVDIEEGLKKVKRAAVLLKTSRERLQEAKNEFDEIKKGLE